MFTRLVLALAVLALSSFPAMSVTDRPTYRGYEAPPYTVEWRDGDLELRRYAPHLVARVRVEGAREAALRRGFRTLARYIFGANKAVSDGRIGQAESQKIAMTVPVGQTGDGRVWDITFMMPARYDRDSLPVPEDEAIDFVETPAERQITLRFSGWATPGLLSRKEDALRAAAAARDLTTKGPVSHYYYDDPFTLPWRRRNEVALVVD